MQNILRDEGLPYLIDAIAVLHRNDPMWIEMQNILHDEGVGRSTEPVENNNVPQTSQVQYVQLANLPPSERSAAETEAAHELLSLAHSLPPLQQVQMPPTQPNDLHEVVYQIILSTEPNEPEQPVNQIPTLGPSFPENNSEADSDQETGLVIVSDIEMEHDNEPKKERESVLKSTYEFQPAPQVEQKWENDFKNTAEEAPRNEMEATTPRLRKTKKTYECNECGKIYATSSNLSRHKQTHRSLDSMLAKRCGECWKVYVSMPALAMHVLTHKMAHVCGICGKQFSRPWLLRGHLRSHTGEKPYRCEFCGKAFADRSNLRAHQQTHSAKKKYECQHCNRSFALKSYLHKHQETVCVRIDDNYNATV